MKRRGYESVMDLPEHRREQARRLLGEAAASVALDRDPKMRTHNMIEDDPRGGKRKAHPEQDLHRAVWKLYQLRYRDCFLMFHPANGEKRSPKTAAILKTMGVVPGVPDFVGLLYGGTLFGLELKAGKGSLTEHQKAMKKRIEELKGEWAEIRSLEDFERWAEVERAAMIEERGE